MGSISLKKKIQHIWFFRRAVWEWKTWQSRLTYLTSYVLFICLGLYPIIYCTYSRNLSKTWFRCKSCSSDNESFGLHCLSLPHRHSKDPYTLCPQFTVLKTESFFDFVDSLLQQGFVPADVTFTRYRYTDCLGWGGGGYPVKWKKVCVKTSKLNFKK